MGAATMLGPDCLVSGLPPLALSLALAAVRGSDHGPMLSQLLFGKWFAKNLCAFTCPMLDVCMGSDIEAGVILD